MHGIVVSEHHPQRIEFGGAEHKLIVVELFWSIVYVWQSFTLNSERTVFTVPNVGARVFVVELQNVVSHEVQFVSVRIAYRHPYQIKVFTFPSHLLELRIGFTVQLQDFCHH